MYESDFEVLDRNVVESPEMLGKECIGCTRVLAYSFYRRDNTYRDGRKDLCVSCESVPRLSTVEHTARLEEKNFNSEAVKKQRWEFQTDYMNDDARKGRPMDHTEFLKRLSWIAKDLYITDGRIEGDLSIFRIYGQPQPHLGGRNFEYLLYIPTTYIMPEASFIEFDERAIPIKERKRGWRTPLLRFIKSRIITEEQANWAFGEPTPGADIVWKRELYKFRNGRLPT